jgi:hypothetical protein
MDTTKRICFGCGKWISNEEARLVAAIQDAVINYQRKADHSKVVGLDLMQETYGQSYVHCITRDDHFDEMDWDSNQNDASTGVIPGIVICNECNAQNIKEAVDSTIEHIRDTEVK